MRRRVLCSGCLVLLVLSGAPVAPAAGAPLVESQCGPLTGSLVAPRARIGRAVVRRDAPRRLSLSLSASQRVEARVRVTLEDGRRIDVVPADEYVCLDPGRSEAEPIALTSHGVRALRAATRPRVRIAVTLRNATGVAWRQTTIRDVRWGAAARTRRPCAAADSHTLLRNRTIRVYRRAFDIYGCVYATGRISQVGGTYAAQMSSSGGGGITRMRIAGTYLASVSVLEDGDRLSYVEVRDLRIDRATDLWSPGSNRIELYSNSDVTDLVVTSTGSMAFIEGFFGPGSLLPDSRLVVRRHDRGGRSILEDSATVDPASLALDGSTISWRSAGRRHTSPIR